MKRLLAIAAVLTPACLAADLPVRDVILYKNGVAFFSREGELKPGEAAKLDFKAAEMNDVLKSLTVADGAGGKVTAVRYDSAEPLDRKLAEFPVRIGGGQSLSAFLDAMRGSQVTMKYGGETVSGTIASARIIAGDRDKAEREQMTMVLDSGDIRAFDLSGMSSIHFNDPAVERQLKAYLGVVAQGRTMDRRNVYIDSTGTAARRVSASYMIPAPVWKSSYRLILDGAAPILEGWAIVDNTTADDWTGVRLALVSGRPVSFLSRLYEPKYRQRQYAELAEEAVVGPMVYEGGVMGGIAGVAQGVASAPPPPPMRREMAAKSMAMPGNSPVAADSRSFYPAEVKPSNIAVANAGQEVGELFEYRFGTPITVKRGESAMLPFLQEKVSARKLLIYSGEAMQNPMNAAEITNSTGKTLDGGPLTVYDAGTYGGEALIETLKAGDKRLISYAVDLGTRITTAIDSEKDFVREIHYNRGVLTTKSAIQETRVYTIKNVDQKAKTLIIEHALRQDYKLLNAKPAETTAHAYRFEVKLAAGAEQKFPVSEERLYENSISVRNESPDTLFTYLQGTKVTEAARRGLQQIIDKKREVAAADAALNRLQSDATDIERDQNRLRQNIASLNHVAGQEQQVAQYSRQLAASETRIVALRDQVVEQRKKKQSLDAALNDLIERTVF